MPQEMGGRYPDSFDENTSRNIYENLFPPFHLGAASLMMISQLISATANKYI